MHDQFELSHMIFCFWKKKMRKLKSYPLAGILKVTSAAGRGKPPVPSRQAVNEKLTSRQGGQENSRIGSISDDSGRESDVRITPTTRYRDSGNSSLGRNRYRPVQPPTSTITNQCNHQPVQSLTSATTNARSQ
jgi:hypothetical protein